MLGRPVSSGAAAGIFHTSLEAKWASEGTFVCARTILDPAILNSEPNSEDSLVLGPAGEFADSKERFA